MAADEPTVLQYNTRRVKCSINLKILVVSRNDKISTDLALPLLISVVILPPEKQNVRRYLSLEIQ